MKHTRKLELFVYLYKVAEFGLGLECQGPLLKQPERQVMDIGLNPLRTGSAFGSANSIQGTYCRFNQTRHLIYKLLARNLQQEMVPAVLDTRIN